MDKQRAIPKNYMTVGEIAKKANTTVRTLQHYDREGLLAPSAQSEGGRRLYTDKDVVVLHQIQSMKYLGFSLGDIKNRLVALETPAEVAAALEDQARAVREKMASLSIVLETIEKLRAETLRMETVDWKKYADIVSLLQTGYDGYWVVRHFDNDMMAHISGRFDAESGNAFYAQWKAMSDEVATLIQSGATPESEQGQALAKKWWEAVTAFTGGDTRMLPKLEKFAEDIEAWGDGELKEKVAGVMGFMDKALESFFAAAGHDPFEGA